MSLSGVTTMSQIHSQYSPDTARRRLSPPLPQSKTSRKLPHLRFSAAC